MSDKAEEQVVHEAVGPALTGLEAAGALGVGVNSLLVLGVIPVLLGSLVDERRITAVNDPAVELWGGCREDLVGMSIVDSIKPAERPAAASEWQAFLRSGYYSGRRDLVRADGAIVEVEFAARWAIVAERRLAVYVATLTGARARERPRLAEGLPLTNREREVLQLLAEGRSNKDVSTLLSLSLYTAETHRSNVMRKMGFASLPELVRYAIRNNIIEP